MTLIVGAVGADYAFLVTDRALSAAGRRDPADSTKSVILTCNNAKIAIAYTGVAIHPRIGVRPFITEPWLLEALASSAKPSSVWPDMGDRLCAYANDEFRALGTAAALTFACVGFSWPSPAELVPSPELAVVSNCETVDGGPKPIFYNGFHFQRQTGMKSLSVWGENQHFPATATEPIVSMLENSYYSADQVVETTVSYMRMAAASSPETISTDYNSIVVPSDPGQATSLRYHHPEQPAIETFSAHVAASEPHARAYARSAQTVAKDAEAARKIKRPIWNVHMGFARDDEFVPPTL